MSEINSSNFKKEHGDLAPDLVGVTELTSPYFFVPPSGNTAERPSDCEPGTLRFNTDIGSLEVFRGKTIGWEQIQRRESQYLGGGTGSNAGTGTRGLVNLGYSPGISDAIDFITIQTLGNAQDFGNLVDGRVAPGHVSSRTRDCIGGGYGPNVNNRIDSVEFASTGDALDFGDLTASRYGVGALSNQIRGVFNGGDCSNVMDYISISSRGNAVDFGDCPTGYIQRGFGNTVRGLWAGSEGPSVGTNNTIHQITIMTTGDSTDFGDLSYGRGGWGGGSNATRGIMMGGAPDNTNNRVNIIDFITIATEGNAQDFGDLSDDMRGSRIAGCASPTRAVKFGGYNPGVSNVIAFVEIATTGNAVDFGDLTSACAAAGSNSNGHGGL